MIGCLREELFITGRVQGHHFINNSTGLHINLLTLNVTFGELTGFAYWDDATESQLHDQVMSVKSLNAPCSVYLSQSDADQNYAHSFNPLYEFQVAPLAQPVPDGGDNLEIPAPFLDDFVPWSPDKESVCDALFPILGSHPCNQSLLLGNEPDIREPTPTNRLNLDNRLINLPEEFSNPQDSRPVAVADPLNRRQATSDNPANSVKIFDRKA